MKHIKLSRQYNGEYFYLNNLNIPNIKEVVIIIVHSEDLGIEAEFEIVKVDTRIDGYVGQFQTKEEAIKAAERKIAVHLYDDIEKD